MHVRLAPLLGPPSSHFFFGSVPAWLVAHLQSSWDDPQLGHLGRLAGWLAGGSITACHSAQTSPQDQVGYTIYRRHSEKGSLGHIRKYRCYILRSGAAASRLAAGGAPTLRGSRGGPYGGEREREGGKERLDDDIWTTQAGVLSGQAVEAPG